MLRESHIYMAWKFYFLKSFILQITQAGISECGRGQEDLKMRIAKWQEEDKNTSKKIRTLVPSNLKCEVYPYTPPPFLPSHHLQRARQPATGGSKTQSREREKNPVTKPSPLPHCDFQAVPSQNWEKLVSYKWRIYIKTLAWIYYQNEVGFELKSDQGSFVIRKNREVVSPRYQIR